MKLQTIVLNLYNQNCWLFEHPDFYARMYRSIGVYLWKQSKKKCSPFQAVPGKWGYYMLRHKFVVQLELCFDDYSYDVVVQQPKKKKDGVEKLPNLFGW